MALLESPWEWHLSQACWHACTCLAVVCVICMSVSGDRPGLCTVYFSRKVAFSAPVTKIQFSRAFKYRFNSHWLCFWAEEGRWIMASLMIGFFFQGLTLWIFCTALENNKSTLHLNFQTCMKAGISAGPDLSSRTLGEILPQRLPHCCTFHHSLLVGPLDGHISQRMRLFPLTY